MQWYLASLSLLLVLVGIGFLTGCLLIVWLPARMQPAARIFLSVPLGWVLLTFVATLLGWFGPGYAHCHSAAVTLVLTAAGAWTGRGWLRHVGGDCLRLVTFVIVASFPFLSSLWRVGSFSLYNDTYLYCGQALWLQHHHFWLPAQTDGGHPAWGTVMLMQQTSLRMGASFLLGWIHAAVGLETPYEIFPAVAALGVICGALSVGATILAACPGRWPEAWLTALAAAVTLNGFAFGAAHGFLPQTWGLAFAATAFGLRGLEVSTRAERSGRARWGAGVPLGLCAAASMHCYWDLLPLEGSALTCTYLWPWPGWSAPAWKETWRRASVPLFAGLLLVNLEWKRALDGILYNLHVVAAGPVAWPVWSFPMHALGLRLSPWEQSWWITQDASCFKLVCGCGMMIIVSGLLWGSPYPERWRHWMRPPLKLARWQWRPLVPALIWTALTAVLFVYFRYAVPSPWHGRGPEGSADGIGQSWSQYKLTIWGSLFFICWVVGCATGWVMRRGTMSWRVALIALLVIWCGTGLGWNYVVDPRRASELPDDTGTPRDPFIVCETLRQRLSTVPASDWVYLDWPSDGRGDKLREVMVLLLVDHPLASNWSTGVSIAPFITPTDMHRNKTNCQWSLRYQPPSTSNADHLPAPEIMTLEKVDHH